MEKINLVLYFYFFIPVNLHYTARVIVNMQSYPRILKICKYIAGVNDNMCLLLSQPGVIKRLL